MSEAGGPFQQINRSVCARFQLMIQSFHHESLLMHKLDQIYWPGFPLLVFFLFCLCVFACKAPNDGTLVARDDLMYSHPDHILAQLMGLRE